MVLDQLPAAVGHGWVINIYTVIFERMRRDISIWKSMQNVYGCEIHDRCQQLCGMASHGQVPIYQLIVDSDFITSIAFIELIMICPMHLVVGIFNFHIKNELGVNDRNGKMLIYA